MKKKIIIILGAIILLAAVLRLWNLGNVPPSPDWDEASLAYNAYSLLQTGKDEYGKFMPIVFESFGDYKPALYAYLAVPFIALFGVDTFAVRLPSALLGILTIVAVYFLVKELFAAKNKSPFWGETVSLLTAFLLAISPWHIQFSRVAFETNVGLAFNIFGALLFIKAFKTPWLLSLAAVFWALSMSVYQSERLFTPLLALAFVIIYKKDFFKLPKKQIMVATFCGLLAILPLLFYIATSSDVFARAKGVSIFSQKTELLHEENIKQMEDRNSGNLIGSLIHNRRVIYLQEMTAGYLSHFSLNWLFITGDSPRHHAPGMGLLYLIELPFLLIGFYILFFSPISKKTKTIIVTWLLLAPLPASLAIDPPHAVRTLNFLPIFQIITALGFLASYYFVQKKITKKYFAKYTLYLIFFMLSFLNISYYLNQYFVQQNYYFSQSWQYGYEDAIKEVVKSEQDYDSVVISDVTPLDQSYIFFLFYLKYSPLDYQMQRRNHHDFDKYTFKTITWNVDKARKKTLFVGSPNDFPEDVKTIKTIYFLDGKPAIKIVGVK